MTSLPDSQLGVLSTKSSRTLKSFSVPSPDADEVLVRNVAVASNPKDWKYPLRSSSYEAIEGNDVAGYIAAVGTNVTEFRVGDKVAAFSKMGTKLNKVLLTLYSAVIMSLVFIVAGTVWRLRAIYGGTRCDDLPAWTRDVLRRRRNTPSCSHDRRNRPLSPPRDRSARCDSQPS